MPQMQAIARHSPALWATAVVAIGLHAAIVAALPRAARTHVTLPAAALAAAVDLAPHAPVSQFQAFAPAAPAQPAAKVEAPKAEKKAAAPVVSARPVAPKAEPAATIDMRPHDVAASPKAGGAPMRGIADDDEPVRIATPLPVTVVTPPALDSR